MLVVSYDSRKEEQATYLPQQLPQPSCSVLIEPSRDLQLPSTFTFLCLLLPFLFLSPFKQHDPKGPVYRPSVGNAAACSLFQPLYPWCSPATTPEGASLLHYDCHGIRNRCLDLPEAF